MPCLSGLRERVESQALRAKVWIHVGGDVSHFACKPCRLRFQLCVVFTQPRAEAVVCNYPHHSLAVRGEHARQLVLDEAGVSLLCTRFVVHVPARAFTDAAHRGKFVNGILSLAPHLKAKTDPQEPVVLAALESP